ncbi:TetR family transcriptional regulator [Leucobacter coleopterorum]|uniref:TetR family transcriptional regulator n=2 Tax=Leucobacter coleopterorum TaxID=2714933 RepID=A0ABX6JZN2_9MICO|nr:TetR family transcriptional regulator [Leucobacter coleopterorum]QIM19776.1 TetR family transcriptional regulator [Leucobacter coleopterorum]
MVVQQTATRSRKPPEERRAEILAHASSIALADGLERVTLRAVADQLGVRPGLISHYFPAVEDLVAAAFELAVTGEREQMFAGKGSPTSRLAALVHRVTSGEANDLARLWLNARHLGRFSDVLARAIAVQEAKDRDHMLNLIKDGVEVGEFHADDPFAACVRIFIAIDGYSVYVNSADEFEVAAYTRFVGDVCEWTLGLDARSWS